MSKQNEQAAAVEFHADDLVLVVQEGHERRGESGTVTKVLKKDLWVLFEGDEEATKVRQADVEILDEEKGNRMAQTLNRYRASYVVSLTASGRKSKACGDQLSQLLEGLDHNQVARVADLAFDQEAGFHREKYGHLNNGQIRMNSGNRVRAAIKRGDLEIHEIEAFVDLVQAETAEA